MSAAGPGRTWQLVVAANRGPVSFRSDPSGEPVVTRGPGGLVTVLSELLRKHPGTWVAAAHGEEEARLAATGTSCDIGLDGDAYRLRYVAVEPDVYHQYYNIVANPILWFIQHYLWDLGWHPDIRENETDAWRNGYLVVNRLFAEAVAAELREGAGTAAPAGATPLVMLHDYHLYRVAPQVRAAAPGAFLQQFVHIPWAQSDSWRVLPDDMRRAVFEGLLGNDIVAFHTEHYVQNFLRGCEEVLDLEVDPRRRTVAVDGREVWVRAYPVSIDPASLRAAAALGARARRRAHAAAAAARAPRAARRPARSFEEHHPRLHRLRPLPRAAPRVPRAHHLPRPAAAVARGRRGVRAVPRARGAHGGRYQHAVRHAGLDADRPAHPGRLPRDARRLRGTTTRCSSTRSATA